LAYEKCFSHHSDSVCCAVKSRSAARFLRAGIRCAGGAQRLEPLVRHGDDELWSFNTESGNFDMPLQLRMGKVHKIGQHNYNIALTGAYTPDGLHQGPAPEWGVKLSFTLLLPNSGN